MASLSKDSDGGRRIQFINGHKQRKTIRLGEMPLAAANEFKRQVAALNWSIITKATPEVKLAQWLNDLDPVLYEKLVREAQPPRANSRLPRQWVDFLISISKNGLISNRAREPICIRSAGSSYCFSGRTLCSRISRKAKPRIGASGLHNTNKSPTAKSSKTSSARTPFVDTAAGLAKSFVLRSNGGSSLTIRLPI